RKYREFRAKHFAYSHRKATLDGPQFHSIRPEPYACVSVFASRQVHDDRGSMILVRQCILATSALLALALPAAPPIDAQSLLDRPPNMSGTWVGTPRTVYFNFLHRFESTPA